MKTFLRNTLVVAALAVGANGLMAAQASSNESTLKQLVRETKALDATAETSDQHKALAAEYRPPRNIALTGALFLWPESRHGSANFRTTGTESRRIGTVFGERVSYSCSLNTFA